MVRMLRPMFRPMFQGAVPDPDGNFDYPFAFSDNTNFSDTDPEIAQYWSDQVSSLSGNGPFDYEYTFDDSTLWDDDDPETAQYWNDQALSVDS